MSISISVIIVGGGLAGLATAIGLQRAGHQVIVLEKSPVLGQVCLQHIQSEEYHVNSVFGDRRLVQVFKFHPTQPKFSRGGVSWMS